MNAGSWLCMNIENKTVLVTGSTDGVGRLVARRLADQGARVLIHGRDRSRGEQLLKEIRTADRGSAAFLPADFSSLAEVRRLADTVSRECERLDILINNAGIGSGGSVGKRETSQDGHEFYMATTMVRQSGVTPISTVEEGAEAILNLAVANELDGRSGQFYNGLRPSKSNPQAYDDTARERLRVLSLQLTGLA
jgi:NAD(P)-dependent dehydrogenase (short-subunit alcohol dehydrogenase family)